MKNIAISIFGLIIAFIGGNCQQTQVQTQILTLSGNQLLFLDWDGGNAIGARVVHKRLIPDSGVDFDIQFQSNEPGDNTINYVSSGVGGQGTLIGFEVSDYKVFSLRFTLVFIDGATGSGLSQELVVGAVIGPTPEGRLSGYTPVTLSFSSGQTTAVSSLTLINSL